AVASGLAARRAGLAELTDGFVNRAEVQDLIGKVHYRTTTDTNGGRDQLFSPVDQGTVSLAHRQARQSPPRPHARGSLQAALTVAELRAKCDDCVSGKLSSSDGAALFTALDKLETLASAGELKLAAMASPSRAAS